MATRRSSGFMDSITAGGRSMSDARHRSRFDPVNPYWETFLDEAGLDMTGARGEGCYIEAADGHTLLDCLAGFGTASLGHAHAPLIARFTEALQQTSVNVFPF